MAVRRTLSFALKVLALSSAVACSDDSKPTDADSSSKTHRDAATSDAATPRDASAADGATNNGNADSGMPSEHADGSSDATADGGPGVVVMGAPGCGLPAAAFCDTFDAPAAQHGRAGELDPKYWSGGRLAPQFPSGNGAAIGIGPGMLPSCRAGLPAQVFPDQDALICDASSNIADKHLLVVAAAQNYGQNSYRIRQPFDFAGRTGKIVFDAEGYVANALLGWISLELTEDPVDAPSFAVGPDGVNNDEGSQLPRNGFEVQFQSTCAGVAQPGSPEFGVRFIDVFKNYASTTFEAPQPSCVSAAQGKLNHFEIRVSQQKIEVYASPVSSDGKTFGALELLQSADVALPFTRGYVQITTHNHATIKYSEGNSLTAWTARWNNVGFDGPVLSNWREYEIPDSLVAGTDSWNRMGPIVNVGYRLADAADAPKDKLTFKGVDLSDVTGARLSLSAWYLPSQGDPTKYGLKYRFNGKAWHERTLDAGESSQLTGSHTQGQIIQVFDVAVADLVLGDNTLEMLSINAPQNYPPVVANIDLVLATK
jgi:hypothetical protein